MLCAITDLCHQAVTKKKYWHKKNLVTVNIHEVSKYIQVISIGKMKNHCY